MTKYVDLVNANASKHRALLTFFGCLTSALGFLHGKNVPHKPGNVFVHKGYVLLPYFGLIHDFIHQEDSISASKVNGMAPRYCTPEVANHEPRSTSSDIWSLGVVFLKTTAVVEGRTVDSIYSILKEHGTFSTFLCTKPTGKNDLIAELKETGNPADNVAPIWLRDIITVQQKLWPTAGSLAASILSKGQKGGGSEIFFWVYYASQHDGWSDFDLLETDDSRYIYN